MDKQYEQDVLFVTEIANKLLMMEQEIYIEDLYFSYFHIENIFLQKMLFF